MIGWLDETRRYPATPTLRHKRVQREIAAGRRVCELCGWPIGSGDHWSLVQEVGPVHSRCGFERGLLGKSASVRGYEGVWVNGALPA